MPRSSRQKAPDLNEALLNLGTVVQLLTQFSMDSMLALLPKDAKKDDIFLQHYKDLKEVCGPLTLGDEHWNARWNKSYGDGGAHTWVGSDPDGLDRGGMPYFCPGGWVRFSLKVCQDKDFENRYKGWGYLYHGTKGKFVGSILTSGLRGTQGLYCGAGETAVYFSPSIEYCSHPRYASVEFNPQTRKYLQIVLQCRVNPSVIWKKEDETMNCGEFGIVPDDNFPDSKLTILVKPNVVCPYTGHYFIQDGVVCTGVMIRATDKHPLDLDNWWANSPEYALHWDLAAEKINPKQDPYCSFERLFWRPLNNVTICQHAMLGSPVDGTFRRIITKTEKYMNALMSPRPFAKGSMRLAYYLLTHKGLFVVKKYNKECKEHIEERLKISLEQAAQRDVNTHLVAQYYAKQYNNFGRCGEGWKVRFLDPFLVTIDGEVFFGEEFINGEFTKWNDNNGHANLTSEVVKSNMDAVASFFSHYTHHASGGKLIIVDLQGWDQSGCITFTDPQIHTRSLIPSDCPLKDRFSMGNHGKTGIFRFFSSHTCDMNCKKNGLVHPLWHLK